MLAMANIETLLVPKHLGSPDGGNQQSDHRINAGKCSFPGQLKTISFILSEVTPKNTTYCLKCLEHSKGKICYAEAQYSHPPRVGWDPGVGWYFMHNSATLTAPHNVRR